MALMCAWFLLGPKHLLRKFYNVFTILGIYLNKMKEYLLRFFTYQELSLIFSAGKYLGKQISQKVILQHSINVYC